MLLVILQFLNSCTFRYPTKSHQFLESINYILHHESILFWNLELKTSINTPVYKLQLVNSMNTSNYAFMDTPFRVL